MKDDNTVRYPQDAPRKRQRRKDSVPHFKTGPPITVRALALWEQTLAATLAEAHPIRFIASVTGTKADDKEGESEHLDAGPALDYSYEHLQSMLVEDEEAADAIVAAIGRLSYEQLQVVQAVLDKHGHQLLADFVHTTAYNTVDPFARCPVGGDPAEWQQQRSRLQAAPLQSLRAKRQQRLQKAREDMGAHAWKVDARRSAVVPPQMAKYAQILAGKHWRDVLGEDGLLWREASSAASSPKAAPHNAWQKAAGSALRASMFGRQSALGARKSMGDDMKAASQHAQHDNDAVPESTVERNDTHTFTGLPKSFWQSEAGNGMHKGVMPSNNPLPCPSVHVLSHSFKPQQRMQVDSGIPSDSMDAIIFAKLGLSLDHTMGVQAVRNNALDGLAKHA
ncbi:hypothetical protein CVIRNUC_009380 [Coccomyxa viridis]|uniref:Uncharacterized protein n=1 Tax=Coccomyxa viridis TaxID=1274662 RepID=A0AAV1IG93_9CHLO|nr:hypothetical protein CVIRNUC_009380 [Coccomyxa viridis]